MRRPRLIIWGPGEVGGAVLRAAHASGRFEIAGVRVFSPHKDGKDAGDLVGIGPIGVRATRSKQEILALDADCAIVTPQPRAVLEGLDGDVIDLLASGKNVVSTAAYHDVAMPNWFNRARTPAERLREIARTRGAAGRAWERWALALVRAVTAIRGLDPLLNVLLRPIADRRAPARATAARLLDACRTGNSTLHGTGVHPTFMVERLLMRLCHSLPRISHIRFAEAGDFSRAPEGMWGGLGFFGFGRDPADLGADWVVARAGDFYYGDLIGNVAHALYGAAPDEVRLERELRGIPAARDLQVGSTRVAAGTTAALHMIHRGYLGDHHFFTNEECWYLGADNTFYGEDVPFGNLPVHGGYAWTIRSAGGDVRGQLSWPALRARTAHPITITSVNALLDAVVPVCRATPGILIDDARPHFRPVAPSRTRRYRVAVVGTAPRDLAADPRFEVVAVASSGELLSAGVDCAIIAPDTAAPGEIDALLLGLLEGGTNVVSTAADTLDAAQLDDACRRGGASIHRISVLATLLLSRLVATMAQALSAARHVRLVEVVAGERTSAPGPLAHAIGVLARDLFAAASVRIDREQRSGPDGAATLHRAYAGDRHVITVEEWRIGGFDHAHVVEALPYGGLRGPASYAVHIQGDPADLDSQWDLETPDLEARMVLDAIAPVCEAAPGIVIEDPQPHYRHDDRIDPGAPAYGTIVARHAGRSVQAGTQAPTRANGARSTPTARSIQPTADASATSTSEKESPIT